MATGSRLYRSEGPPLCLKGARVLERARRKKLRSLPLESGRAEDYQNWWHINP